MSQKPRSGAQARSSVAAQAAAKESLTKPAPAEAEPVEMASPVSMPEEAATDGLVAVESIVPPEPFAESSPIMDPPSSPTIGAPSTEPAPAMPTPIEFSADVPESVTSFVEAASQPIMATADTVAAVTTAVVETAVADEPTSPTSTPKPTLTQGMKTMLKSTEDFVAFGQANLEAFVKSGQIWSAGVQELTKQIATTAKASFDESVSTFKAMSTVKSVKEAIELQSTFAKAAMEKAMAESNKLTDASIKLTEQTLAPITARVTSAVETFGKAA
jgi:phasin family protein